MDRVIGIEHPCGWSRDHHAKSKRLRDRRAAGERGVRAGLLRACTPVVPGRPRCCAA